MNKELEEVAEKYSREVWGVYYDDVHPDIAITQTQGEISVKDFSRGAKWMQEKMFSEEDMREALFHALYAPKTDVCIEKTIDEIVRETMSIFKNK
jgi:hypothetical protein